MTNRLTLTKIALNTSVASMIALSVASVSAQTTPAAAPAVKSTEAAVETIVVTGSRLSRPDLKSTSPVAVITAQELKISGQVNVENVINDLPQFVPGLTSASNNPGNGVTTANLRGLGAQRTLVLVNGHRYINYDSGQLVDLNTIPAALIDRVDVVTGGRSAVYGSDAIAGVINFNLKRNFEGVDLKSEYQVTGRGDGNDWTNDLTIGGNFADGKGNATVYIGYDKRDPVFQGDREFSAFAKQDVGDGTLFNGGSGSIPGGRLIGAGSTQRFLQDGSVVEYNRSTDQYNYAPVNYLQIPLERFITSAQAHYEVNKNLEFYSEAQFINSRSRTQLAPTPTGAVPVTIQINSPFLPTSTQAYLAPFDSGVLAGNAPSGYVNANLARRMVETGPRIDNNERNAFRILTGLRGDVIGNWSYDAYYSFSRTRNSELQQGNISFSKYQNAINTQFSFNGVTSPFPISGAPNGGNLVCVSSDAACIPANLFGANNISAAALNYLIVPVQNSDESQTQVANLTFTNNNLFDLGAGGVGLAIGAEWRKEAAAFNADASLQSGDVLGFSPGQATRGSYSVREFFGELNVPLLKDAPLAKSLELNAAVRYSSYSIKSTGSVVSWSGGAAYSPIKDITFRGQFQRAIRGANVNELYQGASQSSPAVSDPCNNAFQNTQLKAICISTGVPAALLEPVIGPGGVVTKPQAFNEPNSQLQANLGGNSNLKSEKSNTFTLGVVVQPSFLPAFNMTVDYFNIKIKDYISPIGSANILNLCYTQNISAFCGLIVRDPLSGLTTSTPQDGITDLTQNSGGLVTDGVDVGVDYKLNLNVGAFGTNNSSLRFHIAGTYTARNNYTPVVFLPNTVNRCAGKFGVICGTPQPKWKMTSRVTWDTGPLTVSGKWRYIGHVNDDGGNLTVNGGAIDTIAVSRIGATNYFDISANFKASEHLEMTFGVDNIANRYPIILGSNGEQANTYPSVYETLGRKFFISANVKF